MGDSSFARVAGVLFSPRKTFEAIGERPTWLVALVVLVVVGLVVSVLMMQKTDVGELVRDSMDQSSRQMSADQREQMIDFLERFMPVFIVVGALVFGPAGYLLFALILWVVFKLLGGEFSFKSSFSTTLHGLMPQAVSGLLALPVVLSRSEFHFEDVQTGSVLKSNLGILAGEETGAALRTLLASLDVFTLWTVILLAIGFSVVGRVSRTTAVVTTAVLWAAWILIKVAWAAVTG